MLVDTHAHLSDSRFGLEVENIIKNANDLGVEKIICPASNLDDVKQILDITKRFENIYCLAGLYPGEGYKSKNWKNDLTEIEKLIIENPKIVGIGEIGLDISFNEKDEKLETEVFVAQLELAIKLNKPVAIHNRLSHKIITKIFESMPDLPSGMFHCFSGDTDFLKWIIDRGFYVGFDCNVTYPSNKDLRELVKETPLDRLFLETDSPYLPPQGKRGQRNEPANVTILAQMIADIKNISFSEIEKQTTENAERLFNI